MTNRLIHPYLHVPISLSEVEPTNPILTVGNLGQIKGRAHDLVPSVYNFLGVPFADQPINELRFAAPKELTNLGNEIFDATRYSNECVDTNGMNQRNSNTNEDCLYLNVHVPKTAISNNLSPWIEKT